MIRPALIVLPLIPLLAGCGVVENIRNTRALAQEAQEFNDAYDRLDGLTETPEIGLPTGQVAYTGQSAVVIGSGNAEQILIGSATFSADFDGDAITGTLSTFRQYQGGINTTAYSGALTLNNGVLGQAVTNDIDGQFTGTLRGDGDVIGVDVAVNGAFGGDTGDSLVVFGEADTGGFTLNGNNIPGSVQAYGEQQ